MGSFPKTKQSFRKNLKKFENFTFAQ